MFSESLFLVEFAGIALATLLVMAGVVRVVRRVANGRRAGRGR